MDANSNIVTNDACKEENFKSVDFKTMESEVIVMIECNSIVVSLLVRVVVSISTSTITTSVSGQNNLKHTSIREWKLEKFYIYDELR